MKIVTPNNQNASLSQEGIATPPHKQNLILAAIGVSLASALTIILGFAFQVALAALFGTTQDTDAYLAAWTIPNILTMVLFGSLSITFVPVFIEYQAHDRSEDAWNVVIGFFYLCLGFLIVLCTTLALFAAPIIRLTAPGFVSESAIFTLTVSLFQLLLPSVIFNGVANLLRSVYLAQRRYMLASWAPVLNMFLMVIVSIFLTPFFGITAVALATLAGSIAQFLLLAIPILTLRPQATWRTILHPGVRRVLVLMTPWVLSAIFYKSNTLVDRFLASQLDVGAISALGYSYRLMTAISQVLTQGISVVLFPLMAEYVAASDTVQLRRVSSQGVRLTLLIAVPATIAIASLREPMVRILFERGRFDALATSQTAATLAAYLGAFFSGALGSVLTYIFYARQDTITVAIVGAIGFGVNVVGAIVMTPTLGIIGPALAYSLASVFNLIVLTILLYYRLQGFEFAELFKLILKLVPGAALAWLVWIVGIQFAAMLPGGIISATTGLFGVGLLGLVVFSIVSLLFGVTELRLLFDQVWKRIKRRSQRSDMEGEHV